MTRTLLGGVVRGALGVFCLLCSPEHATPVRELSKENPKIPIAGLDTNEIKNVLGE
jgi:hypothetical protein